MDPRIKNLKSTTFQGTRFTRRKLAAIQETVQTFPRLSRHELAQTLCVHHRWQTPKGRNRLAFALRLLQDLERLGILSLPARQSPGRGPQKVLQPGPRTARQLALEAPLASLVPLQLQVAREREQIQEWNEWVQRYHPLGYKPLPGAQLRYFVHAADGLLLALLGFGAAAWRTAPRDRFVGWDAATRQRNLSRVVNHARYLILPEIAA